MPTSLIKWFANNELEKICWKAEVIQFGELSHHFPGVAKEKGKVFAVQIMNAYRGSTGIAPLILNLGTRWKWVVNFTPQPFYPKERTPIEHEAGCD
jgi:hypothetical protein